MCVAPNELIGCLFFFLSFCLCALLLFCLLLLLLKNTNVERKWVCVCVLAVIYNSICLIDFNLLWCYYTQPTADAAAVGAVGGNVLFHPLKTTAHITDDDDLVWSIRSSVSSITNISINGSTESAQFSSVQFSSIMQTHNLLTILEHLIALEHHSPLVITTIAHYYCCCCCWLTTLTTAYYCSCYLLIAHVDYQLWLPITTHTVSVCVQCVVNRRNSQLLAASSFGHCWFCFCSVLFWALFFLLL